jgi:hypothetical protein
MEKEHLEMILEDINGKFELVLEGQESLRKEMNGMREDLTEKVEHNTFLIKTLNQKIDTTHCELKEEIRSVAIDLSAHRSDTEAHSDYQVRED